VSTIARVDETWEGEVPVAALVGEIDASNAREIGDRLWALLTNRLEAMVVDLSETVYVDSAGLNLLFALAEQMRGRQQTLAVVVRAGSPIERMVRITGLEQKASVCASVRSAFEGLASRG
jgi:anti-anti-sigma factor